MSILDTIFASVAPLECLACNDEGYLLCIPCSSQVGTRSPSRCFMCFTPTSNYQTCHNCAPTTTLASVKPMYDYNGLVKQLVADFKFNGKRGGAKDIARLMSKGAKLANPHTLVVHIPTATSRVRMRGYDHAKLLAKSLSHNIGHVHVSALTRVTQGRQVGLSKQQRANNMNGAFRVVDAKLLQGASILLVDDVVTTGASLNEAARILCLAGASRVDAIVFAQAPK